MHRFPLKPQPILIPNVLIERPGLSLSNKNNLTWDDIEIHNPSFLQKIYLLIKRICNKKL